MDYFKLFDIPVSFYPDTTQLARKMVELQKQNHPDYFVNADEHEKMNALTRSSEINQAYKVLTNRDRIVHYVLDQHGMIEEGEKYPLPSDFLMEIMEINEAKMDDAESASWQQSARCLPAAMWRSPRPNPPLGIC